jgi:hypothetical protein
MLNYVRQVVLMSLASCCRSMLTLWQSSQFPAAQAHPGKGAEVYIRSVLHCPGLFSSITRTDERRNA